ncbi:MAG TPA: formimidoylglutamate deiminase [Trebonia sp.]|jgi:formiminoglutamate deiminase
MSAETYLADYAWLPDGVRPRVLLETERGQFTQVRVVGDEGEVPRGVRLLRGVVLPGFANAHSHAFHRALRGRTHDCAHQNGGGTFWTWRQAMYQVAERLDPDSYLRLARAVYAEMALAGVTCAGEFHYVHHAPGGRPYDDPNVMAEALREAARDAGIRLTLLDTAYLAGGLDHNGHTPLDQVQRRFGDGDAGAWAERVRALRSSTRMRVGTAIHSVRAVPAASLPVIVATARTGLDGPLHAHLSEQPAENEACQGFYGRTPAALLADHGVWDAHATAVHATHLNGKDIALLGAAHATACLCPTTERDLADGIGPARALADAGATLSLGSDQHAVIDLLEEARALESHERLASLRRGRFTPAELVAALTAHASLGWPDAGRLEAGARADFVVVRRDTVRTAGALPSQIMMSATAADIDTVVADGREIVSGGRHRLGDVGALLADAVNALWSSE